MVTTVTNKNSQRMKSSSTTRSDPEIVSSSPSQPTPQPNQLVRHQSETGPNHTNTPIPLVVRASSSFESTRMEDDQHNDNDTDIESVVPLVDETDILPLDPLEKQKQRIRSGSSLGTVEEIVDEGVKDDSGAPGRGGQQGSLKLAVTKQPVATNNQSNMMTSAESLEAYYSKEFEPYEETMTLSTMENSEEKPKGVDSAKVHSKASSGGNTRSRGLSTSSSVPSSQQRYFDLTMRSTGNISDLTSLGSVPPSGSKNSYQETIEGTVDYYYEEEIIEESVYDDETMEEVTVEEAPTQMPTHRSL